MKSITALVSYLRKDIRLLKKPIVLFGTLYLIFSLLYVYFNSILEKMIPSHFISIILLFFVILLYSFGTLYNQYLLQKHYSKTIDIPANTLSFFNFISKLLKLILIQFFIFFCILALIIICIVIIEINVKHKPSIVGLIFSLVSVILLLSFIVYSVYWFVRLAFIKYILVYSRINYSNKTIIKESKHMVKKNIGLIIVIFIVFIICLIPQMITNFHNHNTLTTNYISTLSCFIVGLVSTYFFITITVNTILEHKYFFLLEPKK